MPKYVVNNWKHSKKYTSIIDARMRAVDVADQPAFKNKISYIYRLNAKGNVEWWPSEGVLKRRDGKGFLLAKYKGDKTVGVWQLRTNGSLGERIR